jgi:hypothetical protein
MIQENVRFLVKQISEERKKPVWKKKKNRVAFVIAKMFIPHYIQRRKKQKTIRFFLGLGLLYCKSDYSVFHLVVIQVLFWF